MTTSTEPPASPAAALSTSGPGSCETLPKKYRFDLALQEQLRRHGLHGWTGAVGLTEPRDGFPDNERRAEAVALLSAAGRIQVSAHNFDWVRLPHQSAINLILDEQLVDQWRDRPLWPMMLNELRTPLLECLTAACERNPSETLYLVAALTVPTAEARHVRLAASAAELTFPWSATLDVRPVCAAALRMRCFPGSIDELFPTIASLLR